MHHNEQDETDVATYGGGDPSGRDDRGKEELMDKLLSLSGELHAYGVEITRLELEKMDLCQTLGSYDQTQQNLLESLKIACDHIAKLQRRFDALMKAFKEERGARIDLEERYEKLSSDY